LLLGASHERAEHRTKVKIGVPTPRGEPDRRSVTLAYVG
jgi:hypothetical protein